MRIPSVATACFLLVNWLTAMAGDMECGTNLIEGDEENGQTMSEIRQKCGEPDEVDGLDWYYKKEGGATYLLHFNDDGQLESVSEQ